MIRAPGTKLLVMALIGGALSWSTAAWAQSSRQTCLNETGERAITACTAVIKDNSGDVEAYQSRGSEYARRGDFDLAIADYDAAIKLNPDYPLAYYNRGLAFENKNQLQEALADFRRSAGLSPSDRNTQEAIARVTAALGSGAPSAPSNRITSTAGRLDALERLGKLRSSGVLTKQEFEREKRRILGN